MRSTGNFVRRSATGIALLILVTIAVAVSGSTSASGAQSGAQSGAGWPNVSLRTQFAHTRHGVLKVTPLTVGPDGAEFELRLPPKFDLEAHPGSLEISGLLWPFLRISSLGPPTGRHLDLWFSKGGPAIGAMKLTLNGGDGHSYVFVWYIPGGGS